MNSSLLITAFSLLLQAPVGEKSSKDIPNYLELTSKIGTGGQPTDAGFHLLAEKGYKAVINLRTPDEGIDLEAERKLAGRLGLKYFNIPVVSTAPKEVQALEFLKLMEELQDQRVFVHCASANRVGSFVMIKRVVNDGVPLEKAEEEANQIGLRSDVLRQFARETVQRHKR